MVVGMVVCVVVHKDMYGCIYDIKMMTMFVLCHKPTTQHPCSLPHHTQQKHPPPPTSYNTPPSPTNPDNPPPTPTIPGEDLLLASADKPFRFPATFTFVVRSFTVLDGIGKGLDPRFDISEIAAPYARGLLLEAAPQFKRLQDDFEKRWRLQDRAVKNLFRGPNMIEDVASTVRQLERGDLKLRVRALEAERALSRVAVCVCVCGGIFFVCVGWGGDVGVWRGGMWRECGGVLSCCCC